ncbi:MAG TPA: phage tail protein, partial [Candidatus Limnocylindrales bacterium]
MRGLVPGLRSPRPIVESLPGLYEDDAVAQQLTAAFDDVIAPVFATLDNLSAYIDPQLAPEDYLDWLAGWVGAVTDETWDEPRRRAAVSQAAALYRSRGTALGLAGQVELVTAGQVEIVENGATAWSVDPGGP